MPEKAKWIRESNRTEVRFGTGEPESGFRIKDVKPEVEPCLHVRSRTQAGIGRKVQLQGFFV